MVQLKHGCQILLFLAAYLCSHYFASANNDFGVTRTLPNCGLTFNVPVELSFDQDMRPDLCSKTYLSLEGATLLLGALPEGQRDPRWLDVMPSFKIYAKGVDTLLSSTNESGIRRGLSGPVDVMNDFAEKRCSLSRRTHISELSGGNWKGWIVEDSYQKLSKATSRPEYCAQFYEHNRCIRMLIGNSKAAAVMGQYCLTRRDDDFDLDAGLSYGLFLKLVKSIRFIDS